jgi:hypothetical protein
MTKLLDFWYNKLTMEDQNNINLEKIAKAGAKTTVGAIAIAQNMGLVNDEQDLELLIQAGINESLEQLLIQLDSKNSQS